MYRSPSSSERSRAILVLTRKKNEVVVVDGDIRIVVLDIDRGKIRLGIDAPKEVTIMRQELLDEKGEERRAS